MNPPDFVFVKTVNLPLSGFACAVIQEKVSAHCAGNLSFGFEHRSHVLTGVLEVDEIDQGSNFNLPLDMVLKGFPRQTSASMKVGGHIRLLDSKQGNWH